MKRSCLGIFFAALMLPALLLGQAPKAGKNTLVVRGQPQDLYFYPAANDSGGVPRKILYVPGNAGMKRFAVTMAQTIASWGYDVYGLDINNYLESFTDKTKLKETEVMGDFQTIGEWIIGKAKEPVTLVGWSEGAGMCLLAAVPEANKKIFNGLVCIGLGETNVLGWKWSDEFADALKKMPNEPTFRSADYLPKISPLPLVMIQSSQDEWVTAAQTKEMFALAPEPKRFVTITAENHHFKNNTVDFFKALREGLQWINQPAN